MEENAMEKTWETFWKTGKVTDYLTYCNVVSDTFSQRQGKRKGNGTVRNRDGHGFDCHAH